MISLNGRSRLWDIHADGYARGEGYAAIVIKTLERAIDDCDDIESIIRNTGVNQDGRSTDLTVPNANSQAGLIKLTYAKCGLNCKIKEDRCQYFEKHGTGNLYNVLFTQLSSYRSLNQYRNIHRGSKGSRGH